MSSAEVGRIMKGAASKPRMIFRLLVVRSRWVEENA
jgi:hypothetical protein